MGVEDCDCAEKSAVLWPINAVVIKIDQRIHLRSNCFHRHSISTD